MPSNKILLPESLFNNFDYPKVNKMNIGEKIKKVRTAKKLSQKEVAMSLAMDPAQYSRIENGKSDPHLSTIDKIAKALGVELSTLFTSDDLLANVNSADKSVMEKMTYIDALDESERTAFFTLLDALIAKKKLKDNLTNALNLSA